MKAIIKIGAVRLTLVAAVIFSLLSWQQAFAGACIAARFHDWKDMGCNNNHASAGSPPNSSCPPCDKNPTPPGMPQWTVSEPYINLFMVDTPLKYRMSSGKDLDFTFYYRQRTTLPSSDEVSALPTQSPYDIYPTVINCGTNASWSYNWNLSITIWDPTWESSWVTIGNTKKPPYAPYSQGYQVFAWRPEGGINYFNVQSGGTTYIDPKSLTRLTSVTSGQNYPNVCANVGNVQLANAPTPDTNGIYWGNSGVGLKLVYADGAQDVFGLTPFPITDCTIPSTYSTTGASDSRLLLTQRIDPQGRVTQLGYEYITNTFPYGVYYFRLHYVVDPDGHTNTFHYSNGLQLSEIDDPFGRKTQIAYNTTGISSLVDAAGLTNSFSYQGQTANGWVTSLTTPYGTTSFNYYSLGDSSTVNGYQQRAVCVSEPTGAQQLYLYQHQNGGFVAGTETSPLVPGKTFDDGTTGSSGHQSLTYRNTFRWGRRQYAALASNYTFTTMMSLSQIYQFSNPANSQSYFSGALSGLVAADYNKAESKHWTLDSGDQVSITGANTSDRAPSQDPAGATPGTRTWYTYVGQTSPDMLASSPQISCVARLLPDGTSQYTTYNNYSYPGTTVSSFVSDTESTYSKPDGSIGLLTNWFQYAANGIDLTCVSNSVGQYTKYGYNAYDQITSVTNSLNQVTTLSWDVGNTWNLTGITWPNGKSATLNLISGYWDTNSNFIKYPNYGFAQKITWSPGGRSYTFNSYNAGLPTAITDDRNVTTTNTWDGLNRLTSTLYPDGTSISNVYYRLDLVGAKDRMGYWTRYAYDGLQHLTSATNANQAVALYSWCGCGSLTSILNPLGGLTSFNYDNQGNITNISYPDSTSLTYQYDSVGQMTNAVDGAGRSLSVKYNNQGLKTALNSAFGTLQKYAYDAVSRPLYVTDANGITVTNQYDAIGELLSRTWPDGIADKYAYSAAGLMAYTNRDNQPTFYGYDTGGRMTSMTNANGEVTQVAYDSLNNMTDLWDGKNDHTVWQYDQYGRMTNKVDALGRNIEAYAYNANDWVVSRQTPEKGMTRYSYDAVGNRLSINYPQAAINYAYDALNRLTNMVDSLGVTAFGYTPAGQLQSENGPWANDSVTYTLVQQLRTAMAITQPGGSWTQTYGYDSQWRTTNIVTSAGSFGYAYNYLPASALVSAIALPNGASITNGYDGLGRIFNTALNNSSQKTLDGYSYINDPLGLRTNIMRNLGGALSTVTATYDSIGQLTGWFAKETNTVRLNEQLGWAYDPAGNLKYRTNNALTQTFTTDNANELSSITRGGNLTVAGSSQTTATSVTVNGWLAQAYGDNTFASAGKTLSDGYNTFTAIAANASGVSTTNTTSAFLPAMATLQYDRNGNLTNDGYRSFAYDCENQLTAIQVVGQWRTTMAYDGLNRRRIIQNFAWQSGNWVQTNEVHYIYDGLVPVQERDGNNNVLVTYTRGLDVVGSLNDAGGIGGLLARTDGQGTTYYHADGIGNVTTLINGSQNVVARYLYNPFGQMEGKWGSLADANSMQFSSMAHHNLSGLSLYAYRAYDPSLQRWLNRDPIEETGGINLYQFVGNNSIRNVDPLGLDWEQGLSDLADAAMAASPVVGGAEKAVVETCECSGKAAEAVAESAVYVAKGAAASVGEAVDAVKATEAAIESMIDASKAVSKICPHKGNPRFIKLKGNQGWKDAKGNIWKKDQLHKDHWDVLDSKGNKIKEVDFNGNQIWPGGPKNKNK